MHAIKEPIIWILNVPLLEPLGDSDKHRDTSRVREGPTANQLCIRLLECHSSNTRAKGNKNLLKLSLVAQNGRCMRCSGPNLKKHLLAVSLAKERIKAYDDW